MLAPQDLPVPGPRVELHCKGQGDPVDDCRLSIAETVTVAPEPLGRRDPIGSVSLSDADLKAVAGSTSDLIRHATLLAGAANRAMVIYVDGLPVGVLPPIDTIERISVNPDAFSAEYADGDVTSIHIVTRAPDRAFRFNAGSDLLGLGGHDVIASNARAASRSGQVSVSGPVPRLPITFSARFSYGRTSTDVPIQAAIPNGGAVAGTSTATNRARSGSVDVHYLPGTALRATFSYRESRTDGSNLGVGGLVLPDAGFASSFTARDARTTITGGGSRLLYEGGFVVDQARSSTTANSDAAGIAVLGDFVGGGASSSADATNRTRWTTKHVIRSGSSRSWSAGVTLAGTDDASRQTPNAAGTFQFADAQAYASALAGGATATWFVTRGTGDVRYANITAAPFVQKTVVRSEHIELDGGVRADYQSGFGAAISPRVSAAAEWMGLTLRAGAGLFVRSLPGAIFVSAITNDGQHLQQFMATNASLVNIAGAPVDRQASIRSRLSPDLSRSRQRMERISVQRRTGNFVSGLEYTWTSDALAGSERLAEPAGWTDVVESNRAAAGRRFHAQIGYTWKGQQFSANYELTRARDNTDGPFSFPERAGDLAGEWARRAGAPPHAVTAAGTFRLPGAVSLNVTDSWHNAAPFNITTGIDAAGNGLTLDRGGRARNSGDGPGYNSLAAYAYRRVPLPNMFGKSARRIYLDLGLQADNILDQRNYISVGAIAGSSTFGKPLAAFPGRSLRLFLNID